MSHLTERVNGGAPTNVTLSSCLSDPQNVADGVTFGFKDGVWTTQYATAGETPTLADHVGSLYHTATYSGGGAVGPYLQFRTTSALVEGVTWPTTSTWQTEFRINYNGSVLIEAQAVNYLSYDATVRLEVGGVEVGNVARIYPNGGRYGGIMRAAVSVTPTSLIRFKSVSGSLGTPQANQFRSLSVNAYAL